MTRETVIYTAAHLQQATLLKNELEALGIRSFIINTGVHMALDYVGLETNPRVVVDEADAVEARRIALEFDERSTRRQGTPQSERLEVSAGSVVEAWPTCPGCGKRRQAVCPSCGTAGNDFPSADSAPQVQAATAEMEEGDTLGPAAICPTCDEPFAPEYLRHCEWCNHDFGDGQVLPEKAESPKFNDDNTLNSRVMLVIAGIVALSGLIVWYMKTVVSP